MKSKNTHLPKLIRSLALLGSVCGFLFLASPAQGAVILTISDNSGPPNSTDVDLNVSGFFSFTVSLTLTAPHGITGLTYLLETPQPSGSGQFQITARNTNGAVFSGANLTTPDATVLTPANALLDPRNNNDLGGTVADVFNDCIPPGSYFVATYTMEAKPTIAAGTYTIQLALQSATGCGPDFDEISVAPATYAVRVVPEPGAGCLLCLGSALLGFARRKNRL